MSQRPPPPTSGLDPVILRDENEQLRTALEAALDENARLVNDGDRLRSRITVLARDLHASTSAQAGLPQLLAAEADARERQGQSEEELRVAFEELQVLTEELEAANTMLHETNLDLDARVAQRTSELARANASLRVTEASLRAIADLVPDLLWQTDQAGSVSWYNKRWYDYTGQPEERSLGSGWTEVLLPDERDALLAGWHAAVARGQPYESRQRTRGADGVYRWFLVRAHPLRDASGAITHWYGAATDIDQLVQLQEQQTVLVAELQHRTRNLMAVVQSIMTRTIGSSTTLEDFRPRIADRLASLARVQELLSRRADATRVTFDSLIRAELSAHVALDADDAQISLRGPAGVPLRSATVQTLALALHELATNAVKYGALAKPDGRLDVSWRVAEPAADNPLLCIEWIESGVQMSAPDATPRGGGYGRELIERALPFQLGARTQFSMGEDGVRCSIEMAIPGFESGAEDSHAG